MPLPVDPAALAATLDQCRGAVHAPLPRLTEDQVTRAASGEVVRIVRHGDPDQPSTAIGLVVLEGSIEALWLAAQDPHTHVDPSLTEFVLEELPGDRALWYGYLDLPAPLADRQWVVTSADNRAAASLACWEHHWELTADALPRARAAIAAGAAPGLAPEQVDAAVLTPVNHGAWLLSSLGPDHTLVVYQATSVVGGAIPDWLVLKLTTARLESVLRQVETLGRDWVPGHYGLTHAPVNGPDGRPLEPWR
jgi:hypothetical protein